MLHKCNKKSTYLFQEIRVPYAILNVNFIWSSKADTETAGTIRGLNESREQRILQTADTDRIPNLLSKRIEDKYHFIAASFAVQCHKQGMPDKLLNALIIGFAGSWAQGNPLGFVFTIEKLKCARSPG